MVVPKDCHIQNVSAQEIFFIKPCRQSLLEAVGLCVENASVDQLSFAINKIFLTGFDEKVLHRIMSIISERLVLPIIKSQDSEATNLTNFNIFSFLNPTTATEEMKEYW